MKVTQKQIQDETEDLVLKSYSETIYIIDDITGLVINKLVKGEVLPVTPEEQFNNQ